MNFEPNTVIADHRGEQRWCVIKPLEQLPNLKRWEVKDQAPGMERVMQLLTLDYSKLPATDRDFAIQQLRDDFMRVIRILGEGGYNFLPEAVDWITFTNSLDPMDADLRGHEIGLIHTHTAGSALFPIQRDQNGQLNEHHLRRTVLATLKTMRVLHDKKVVMQALARTQILLNPVTYQPYFKGIQTLMFMGEFTGFNPNRHGLAPSKIFAAPECFDPCGRLTPATDIYALGKLALQLLFSKKYFQHFTPDNPFPVDVQNLINSLGLPEPWPCFLSMCLQQNPKQRFQTATEAEVFLMPSEKQKSIKEQRGYRENPQLPDAMLLIWGEHLIEKNQRFNFRKLYQDVALTYNLKPRLYFQTYYSSTIGNNTFFVTLQEQFGLTVIPLLKGQNPIGVLNHTLDPHLSSIRHLILVGGADEAGVQCLLQHPDAGNWRIHWICGAGNWTPSIAVEQITDAAKYLQDKRS